eukprot:Seg1013.3 transcript_id=Seg1013.3/GoldUCD/mRNA.D3Y31 product=Ankyrin-3 protein_id=Seg1013.3/GoldUCD/D3Y31
MGNTQTAFEGIESQPLDIQLLHAAEYGDSDLLVKLLDGSKPNDSFDIDVTKHSLWTPLFMAAKQGHAGCVRLLLEAGALVDGINNEKSAWTPLWVAVYAGHADCVELLLGKGAKLEAKHPETPLFIAAREERIECLRLLIKAGANLNVVDKSGRTPLHIAASENLCLVAEELIIAGCKLEIVDDQDYTPLINACFSADENLLEVLLKGGADHTKTLNSKLFDGYTAMHICACKSKKKSIKILWKYGANLFDNTKDGSQPIDLATDDLCRKCIMELQGTVRPLKDMCRLKINKLLPRSKFDELLLEEGMPKDLIAYLKYEIT